MNGGAIETVCWQTNRQPTYITGRLCNIILWVRFIFYKAAGLYSLRNSIFGLRISQRAAAFVTVIVLEQAPPPWLGVQTERITFIIAIRWLWILFTFIESGRKLFSCHKLSSCDILRSHGLRINVENVSYELSASIPTSLLVRRVKQQDTWKTWYLFKKQHPVIYQNTWSRLLVWVMAVYHPYICA